jgi:hypothetical protein
MSSDTHITVSSPGMCVQRTTALPPAPCLLASNCAVLERVVESKRTAHGMCRI